MMKKMNIRLTTVLGIMVLFFMLTPMIKVEAKEKVYTWGDYTYTIEKGYEDVKYVDLKDYNGQEENLVLPEEINSIPVWGLMDNYKYPDKIKTITFSKNTGAALEYANPFQELINLEAVYVPKENQSLESVDGVLFRKRRHLPREKGKEILCYPIAKKNSTYTIPDTVTYIEEGAFESGKYLKKVVIGKQVETVGEFENSNIQTVILSDGVKCIDEDAFRGCKKLRTVIMGKNVLWIDIYAFSDCVSLKNITLPKGLVKIHSDAFGNCKSLKGTLTIPESVYSIEREAFRNCPVKLKMPAYMRWQKSEKRYRASIRARDLKNGKIKYCSIMSVHKILPVDKMITIKKGHSKKLQVNIKRWDEKLRILDTNILKYTSSNPKIARVSKHGNIKAYKKGKVTIKVDFRAQTKGYDPRKKYCYVTIKVK